MDLMLAMLKPDQLAIIKCQAHKKGNDFVVKGNNKADEIAKQASGCKTAVIAPMEVVIHSVPTLEDVKDMQQVAAENERAERERRGAKNGHDGMWRSALSFLLTLLISEAHGVDHCARGEVMRSVKKRGVLVPILTELSGLPAKSV